MENSEGPAELRKKKIVFSIMRFLQDQLKTGNHSEENWESLEVGLDCIGQVYQLRLTSEHDISTYGSEKSLEELFQIATHAEPSSGSKKEAEAFKAQGNAHIKNGEVDKAVECYSRAIALDPTNATYFCNRAAGLIKQKKLGDALADCRQSVKLNPDYARAHGRMGYVYSSQGRYAEAKMCFTEATKLDPDNQSYKENLITIEQQLQTQPQGGQQGGGAASGSASGGGAAAGGGGGGGGGGGIPGLGGMSIGNMLNNPAFMNMASTLMSQPGFQQMAGRMMGSMGGGEDGEGAGEGAGEGMMPQVMRMAQDMQQNNPELYHNLQQQAHGLAAQQQQQQNRQNPNQQ